MKINKDILLEGKYDSVTRIVSNDIFKNIKDTEGELDEAISFSLPYDETGDDYYVGPNVQFEVELLIYRTNDDISYGDKKLPYFIKTYISVGGLIFCEITIDESYGKDFYQEIYYKINEDIRHEIEHYIQELGVSDKKFKERQQPLISNTSDYENTFQHHMDPSEVEALVHGFYRKAKISKKPLDVVMLDDLKQDIDNGNLNQKEAQILFNTWLKYAKIKLPNAIYSNLGL